MTKVGGIRKIMVLWQAVFLVACSRLRDGGGKSFSNKKCEKRAGAGERQGVATAPFTESCASYFRFTRFNTVPLYYLRAWHRLELKVIAFVTCILWKIA